MDITKVGNNATDRTASGTQTNGQVQVTITAPGKGELFLTYVTISASAAPGAPVSATIAFGASTVMTLQIPAAAFAPIVIPFTRPVAAGPGNNIVVTLPALGAAVVGTVNVGAFSAW